MNTKHFSAIGILLMIGVCLLGTLLFDTTAEQSRTDSPAPMIIRVDPHTAVNTAHICTYYIEPTPNTDTAKLYADLTNGMRIPLRTGTLKQCESCLSAFPFGNAFP